MEIERIPETINTVKDSICALELRVTALEKMNHNNNAEKSRVRLWLRDDRRLSADEISSRLHIKLDDINGIMIPLLDGRTALMFPKYKMCRMLDDNKRGQWSEKSQTEIEAMYDMTDTVTKTSELENLGSPAAKFVREVTSHMLFGLPNLLGAIAIIHHIDEINRIASCIKDADIIQGNSNVWSCSRYSADYAWYSYGSTGYVNYANLYGSYLAVPLLLLDVPLGAS